MAQGFVLDLILGPLRIIRERIEDLIERVYWMGFATGFAVGVAGMLLVWIVISQRRS